jgi:hypothetical protein
MTAVCHAAAWLFNLSSSHGVTVSTLDSEPSDRGPNPPVLPTAHSVAGAPLNLGSAQMRVPQPQHPQSVARFKPRAWDSAWLAQAGIEGHGSHGVTVSTLDSESSDRGSNPRESLSSQGTVDVALRLNSARPRRVTFFTSSSPHIVAMAPHTYTRIARTSARHTADPPRVHI